MKYFIHALLASMLLMLSVHSFGQSKKYFVNKLGQLIDQPTYDKKKAKSLASVQSQVKSMELVEDLTELYDRNDSIVYLYAWHFTDSPSKTLKEIEKKRAMIGRVYPIKDAKTTDGRTVSIEDFKGKPTLVNLWFTACAPCIEEMPTLNKMRAENSDRFNFLSITFDSEKKVQKLLKKINFDWEHIVGSKELTTQLGFQGFPVNLFLDKDGIVRIIEGNVPFKLGENGETVISDGAEFIKLLEGLL